MVRQQGKQHLCQEVLKAAILAIVAGASDTEQQCSVSHRKRTGRRHNDNVAKPLFPQGMFCSAALRPWVGSRHSSNRPTSAISASSPEAAILLPAKRSLKSSGPSQRHSMPKRKTCLGRSSETLLERFERSAARGRPRAVGRVGRGQARAARRPCFGFSSSKRRDRGATSPA